MRVAIDGDICEGHGLCLGEAPEVFQLAEDGSGTVLIDEPPERLRGQVADALRTCPTGAISISD